MKAWMTLCVCLLLLWGTPVFGEEPRGIRNNNPLNIERTADQWVGMSKVQEDSRFVTFTSPAYGYRAATKILLNYICRGNDTVREIIHAWAPVHENPTLAYAKAVAYHANIGLDEKVELKHFHKIMDAMTWFENGKQPYTQATIRYGIMLAIADEKERKLQCL